MDELVSVCMVRVIIRSVEWTQQRPKEMYKCKWHQPSSCIASVLVWFTCSGDVYLNQFLPVRVYVCIYEARIKMTTNAKTHGQHRKKNSNQYESKEYEKRNENKSMQSFTGCSQPKCPTIDDRMKRKEELIWRKVFFFVSYNSQSFARRISELRIKCVSMCLCLFRRFSFACSLAHSILLFRSCKSVSAYVCARIYSQYSVIRFSSFLLVSPLCKCIHKKGSRRT